MSYRILIIDDEEDMCDVIAMNARLHGYDPYWRTSPKEALALLDHEDYDVVVTDLKMPGLSGTQLCERISAKRPDIPVVVITAFGSLDTAIAAIRAGAYDFLTKPFEFAELALILDRAATHRAMSRELKRLRQAVNDSKRFEALVGDSPAMKKLYDLLDRIGDSAASVLITGESGTGKELVARALHRRSNRGGEFVAINCAAMPESLLESELFGHEKGAFTDANVERKGLFRQAHEGTLFLDEIAEMPLGLQAKLLRALQERKVRPVGGDREHEFDARIVAATNKDIESAVENKLFREDLYFRINVIRIQVPPLRARGNDIILLAHHFLELFKARTHKPVQALSAPACEKLLGYSWPGNVRELENCIARAVAMARYDEIVVEDLPEKVRNYQVSHIIAASDDPADLVSMEEIERRYIRRVLQVLGNNKSHAAKILGWDRKTLYRRIEKYGLDEEFGDI
jgi:two-component system response regulator HydG